MPEAMAVSSSQQGEGLGQQGWSHTLLWEGTVCWVLLVSGGSGLQRPNMSLGSVQAVFVPLPTLVPQPHPLSSASYHPLPPYLLCIKIGNLKLYSGWERELIPILTSGTVMEENIFNVSFTTSRANGFCSNKAAVKVLLANPNLLTWKRARKPPLHYLHEVLMQQGSPVLRDN